MVTKESPIPRKAVNDSSGSPLSLYITNKFEARFLETKVKSSPPRPRSIAFSKNLSQNLLHSSPKALERRHSSSHVVEPTRREKRKVDARSRSRAEEATRSSRQKVRRGDNITGHIYYDGGNPRVVATLLALAIVSP